MCVQPGDYGEPFDIVDLLSSSSNGDIVCTIQVLGQGTVRQGGRNFVQGRQEEGR